MKSTVYGKKNENLCHLTVRIMSHFDYVFHIIEVFLAAVCPIQTTVWKVSKSTRPYFIGKNIFKDF